MDKKYVIAIDFDGNLKMSRLLNPEEQQRRIEIVRKLIKNGHKIYILTASLQPFLKEMYIDSGVHGDVYCFRKTDEYFETITKIRYWLNQNIGIDYDWLITPIKQHYTDFYVDVNNKTWEEIENLIK